MLLFTFKPAVQCAGVVIICDHGTDVGICTEGEEPGWTLVGTMVLVWVLVTVYW